MRESFFVFLRRLIEEVGGKSESSVGEERVEAELSGFERAIREL